ncbi:MAG: glycosyltransferase family 4 protein [Propionibacteriaceae bacterium]|nr:glycosyltransferase family 4 protein [Propionibacteriaceae bacterium]
MIVPLRRRLTDVVLALDTSVRGLMEDPLHFAVQVARRLKLVGPPGRHHDGLLAAYRWFLADQPDQARDALSGMSQATGWRRRLARRLAVQLGMFRAEANDPPRLRAQDLAQAGALSAAADAAPPGSRLAARLASERAVLAPAAQRSRGHRGHPSSALFLLTNSLPHTRSGYTVRSHEMLTALSAAGVEVNAATRIGYPTTVGILGSPLTSVVDGIPYHRLPAWRLPVRLDERVAAHTEAAARLLTRIRPGVLHCTTDYTNALVARELSSRFSLPWVYEMRGQLELTWVASRPESLRDEAAISERVRLLRAKEAELATDAHAVIVLSQVQREDLISRGVPPERIAVLPNATDPSLLNQDLSPGQARVELGLPAEGVWVGSVSSLVGYEGFDVLLDAVARCRTNGIDVRCAIAGDGVSRPGLAAQAEALGLGDAVVLPGRQPRDRAALWHQALDAFAVPRHDLAVTRVVTPLKPIEAMALGRPVIASDLPALAELAKTPGSGLLTTPGDADSLAEAIGRLAADEGLRSRLASNGRRFAAGRTWPANAARCRQIYQDICHV